MRIFIDNGDFKFFIEDSYSEDLKTISKIPGEAAMPLKNTIAVITIDNKHSEEPDQIKSIIKISKNIIKAAMGMDYFDEIITSVKFD